MLMANFGALSAREFLRKHWQKRPLLVRGAMPGFAGVIDFLQLRVLARRDDVESRIVERRGGRWETRHGPFRKISSKAKDWTLLVSGVNLHVEAADELLRRFSFIPHARLDDVMVSYATPGGGVGPHVDSYDVFLLQGPGRRRWRFGKKSYVLGPGDMLYLPPGIEHDGVAIDSCTTCSIGFRAPRGAELGAAFLDWLHERGLPDAVYGDKGLRPTQRAGHVPVEMIDFADRVLSRIRWSRGDITDFLGRYLTTPKPHVVFRPTPRRGGEVQLDARTQLLYAGRRFFINGESFVARKAQIGPLRELADRRRLAGSSLAPIASLIGEWRKSGYLHG
jgi:50S ribosomal protein L16 3-hydroxylase